jgi:hypothetical protein
MLNSVDSTARVTARIALGFGVDSVVAMVAMTACAVSLTACSISFIADNASGPSGSDVVNPRDAGPNDATVDSGAPEAAAADGTAASTYQGNPLCKASRLLGCYPDDTLSPMTANTCGPIAGLNDSGAMLACHVEPGAQGPHAVCLPAGTGRSGSACAAPTDCASGFECVGGGPMNVCRPYCCGGQDRCASDDAGTGEFCDIQSAVPSQTSVPVCMPVRPCTLLNDADAAHADCMHRSETCSVVSDDGVTSCVSVGPVPVGGGCDTDHCAADLVCLGTPGQRRCYQLCLTMGGTSDCPSTQTCKGGLPLFPDPRVGICQ